MNNLVRTLAITAILVSTKVVAQVTVSPVMALDQQVSNFVVNAKSMQVIPLPTSGSHQDAYRIKIDASNAIYKDITAYILDQKNLLMYQSGQTFSGLGYQKAIAPFIIQGSIPFKGPKFLILDNRYASIIAKKVNITIEAKLPLTSSQQQKTQQSFEELYANLKKKLIFPDFNIRVEPCGQINAFSDSFGSGDIHYCTETISYLSRTNNAGAFTAIFLHEVGHSLLGLWGVPGNNNEDIADEFATYVLMSSGPNGYALLNRSLEFWEGRDTSAEIQNMLTSGDRHSLSVQRIRNIKENMQRGEAFIKRWNTLIYPHVTEEALNAIVQNPSYGDNVALAEKIISERK